MRKNSAIVLMQEIERLCESNNAYCFVTHEKKPHLTGIKVEVSIKIEPEPVKGENLKAT